MSCLFHVSGLVLSVCVLLINFSTMFSPAGPMFLIIVYVILSAPGAVSLLFLYVALSSASV